MKKRRVVTTIEIHRPELEALIRERMDSGAYHNLEDVLLQALKSAPSEQAATGSRETAGRRDRGSAFRRAARSIGARGDREARHLAELIEQSCRAGHFFTIL